MKKLIGKFRLKHEFLDQISCHGQFVRSITNERENEIEISCNKPVPVKIVVRVEMYTFDLTKNE